LTLQREEKEKIVLKNLRDSLKQKQEKAKHQIERQKLVTA
jgi:hypothetical protein